MDGKIKTHANEIAYQVIKNGSEKVAVTTLDYKGCNSEFGKFPAEELTRNLSVSGRAITVVNQKMLESLLSQNRLTAKGVCAGLSLTYIKKLGSPNTLHSCDGYFQ